MRKAAPRRGLPPSRSLGWRFGGQASRLADSLRPLTRTWLPDPYAARNPKSLGAKDRARAIDRREPYFLHWRDHTLDFTWGERPALLAGSKPLNQRQLRAFRNHEARVSPIGEARRYLAELNHPGVRTKAEVAVRFGVSRARVVQYLNLLSLDPRIVEFLDTSYGDPIVTSTFTERRLRDLLTVAEGDEQWKRFHQLIQEARSKPGVWNQAN